MNTGNEATLAEQREAVRVRLQAQRRSIAQHLGPPAGAHDRYPRSMTMRLLIERPTLLLKLLAMISRARIAGSMAAILVLLIGQAVVNRWLSPMQALPAPRDTRDTTPDRPPS